MNRILNALMALACLSAAAAVSLAAAGAHIDNDSRLTVAANVLLPHAIAAIALGCWALRRGESAVFVGAAWLLLIGADLFAADLTMRVFQQARLFPYAAPLGGILTICGWLLGAGGAIFDFFKSRYDNTPPSRERS